jgi:hypothetical protein
MKDVGGLVVYALAFWGASGTYENIASIYNAKLQSMDYMYRGPTQPVR